MVLTNTRELVVAFFREFHRTVQESRQVSPLQFHRRPSYNCSLARKTSVLEAEKLIYLADFRTIAGIICMI